MALIDEPEAALHPAAAKHLASALSQLADVSFVATHSVEVFDEAAQAIHVTRDEGWIRLAPLEVKLVPEARALEARRLGVTLGQLNLLYRVIVLVEGPHDVAVINGLLHDDLAAARVLLLPLMGTKNLPGVDNSGFLVSSTTAPILVCMDNADERALAALRRQLDRTPNPADKRRLLAQMPTRSSEQRTLAGLLSSAAEANQLHRIHTFGFAEADIVRYLPAELFRPGATSWDALVAEFLTLEKKSRMEPGDGARFKRFVGPAYSVKGINEALDRMRLAAPSGRLRPSGEFKKLAERIRDLALKAN